MGMPKINVASLRCPQCTGLTRLMATKQVESGAGRDLLSFECNDCGSFEVLAISDREEDLATDSRVERPGGELQDLWAQDL
jgi:hypothetical protein